MSEAKFTPGPWTLTQTKHQTILSDWDVFAGSDKISLFPYKRYYSEDGLHSSFVTDHEKMANAHLISAAPDLYELLAAADMLIIWESMGFTNEFADRVEAALAKARGESC